MKFPKSIHISASWIIKNAFSKPQGKTHRTYTLKRTSFMLTFTILNIFLYKSWICDKYINTFKCIYILLTWIFAERFLLRYSSCEMQRTRENHSSRFIELQTPYQNLQPTHHTPIRPLPKTRVIKCNGFI